jgi:hypothetical protein
MTTLQMRHEMLRHVAGLFSDNLNDGVDSIFQWVRMCHAFADGFDLTDAEKVYFLAECGMDIVIGTEWRNEYDLD